MTNEARPESTAVATRSAKFSQSLGKADSDIRATVVNRLEALAHSQQLYGKSEKSLKAASQLIMRMCRNYTVQQVNEALETWMKREKTFPAPSDIIALIERNGKPPLDRAVYIEITRKAPELRTSDDWSYIRQYEAEARGGDVPQDDDKMRELRKDNRRLREELAEAKREIEKLNELLKDARNGWNRPKSAGAQQKIDNTVAEMIRQGRSEAEIDEFMESMKIHP